MIWAYSVRVISATQESVKHFKQVNYFVFLTDLRRLSRIHVWLLHELSRREWNAHNSNSTRLSGQSSYPACPRKNINMEFECRCDLKYDSKTGNNTFVLSVFSQYIKLMTTQEFYRYNIMKWE